MKINYVFFDIIEQSPTITKARLVTTDSDYYNTGDTITFITPEGLVKSGIVVALLPGELVVEIINN